MTFPERGLDVFRGVPQFAISVAIYAAAIAAMLLFTVEAKRSPTLVQVFSTLAEAPKSEDFLDLVQDFDE